MAVSRLLWLMADSRQWRRIDNGGQPRMTDGQKQWRMAAGDGPRSSHRRPAINQRHQFKAISHQPSAIGHQPLTISHK
jgi:hypothetical protein